MLQPGDGIIITKSSARRSSGGTEAKAESFAAVITTVTHFDSLAVMLKHVSLDALLPGIEDEFQAVGLLESMYPPPSRKEDRGVRKQKMIVFGLDTSTDASASVLGSGRSAAPGIGRFQVKDPHVVDVAASLQPSEAAQAGGEGCGEDPGAVQAHRWRGFRTSVPVKLEGVASDLGPAHIAVGQSHTLLGKYCRRGGGGVL